MGPDHRVTPATGTYRQQPTVGPGDIADIYRVQADDRCSSATTDRAIVYGACHEHA